MSTDVNMEELAATLAYRVEKVMEALGELQTLEPVDLVDAMGESYDDAVGIMDALTELRALGREAGELHENLGECGF